MLQRAYEDGFDEVGQRKWRYEDLPPDLQFTEETENPMVVAKLQGDVAHIGLNTLIAWNVVVHPRDGLQPAN